MNQFLKDLDAIDEDLSYKLSSQTAGPIVKLPDGKLRGLHHALSQFATIKPQPPKPEPKPDPPKEYKDQSVIDALLAVENDDQALRAMIKDIMHKLTKEELSDIELQEEIDFVLMIHLIWKPILKHYFHI